MVAHESWHIGPGEDVQDITPFYLTIPWLPSDSRVILKVAEREDLHAVHVFPTIRTGQAAAWGGFAPVAGTTPWVTQPGQNLTALEMDITRWVRPVHGDSMGGYPGTEAVGSTYFFGLEGLVFRGMLVPEGSLADHPGRFSGEIDLGLEIRIPGRAPLDFGSVRMKNFHIAQELQAPVFVDIGFTEVGHIDEVFSFGPDGKTYIPDPAGAVALLQAEFETEEKQLAGVLFSPDTAPPSVAKVWKTVRNHGTPYIITDLDYDSVSGQ